MSEVDSKNNKTDDYEGSKDYKLDKIFWFKFVFSLFFGVLCGILGFTGIITFIFYFISSTIISHLYFNKFLAEEEETDYQADIFVEGLNVSIPTFLLVWILSFTYSKLLMVVTHGTALNNEYDM